MDRALISCERFRDLPSLRAIAESNGMGFELQEFADPTILDGDWRGHVARYRKALSGFSGELSLHGAFFDMYCGSPDRQVVALARERFRQNLTIAAELGAHLVNFHINFLPLIDDPRYPPAWTERQIAFWSPMAQEARGLGVTIVLENMWEPDPHIQRQVLDGVHSPHLKACLDVGHAVVYSQVPLDAWIKTLEPYLFLTHLHNTNGKEDVHLRFGQGVLDMTTVLDQLRHLPRQPIFCLELPDASSIEASLKFLHLGDRK
jgi:sugar phosphate isomerase/epimerase